MPLSGVITGRTSNAAVHVQLTWTETAVNTANNTSTVHCVLTYSRHDDLSTFGSGYYSITCDGATQNRAVYTSLDNSSQDVMDVTFTVTHGSDGKKTAAISATGYISGTTVDSTTLSGSAVLTDIPRANTLTLSKNSVTMNGTDAITLTVSRASTSYTHTIVATHGENLSKTICTKDTGTNYSLTIPSSWCSNVPNSMSGGAWITITTYSGNTQVGQNRYNFTINVPTYTLSPSITSAIASGGYGGYYIDGKSKTKLTASCSAQYGGSISSCVIKEGNTTLANGTTYTSGLLTTGSHTYTAYITDSRGITASTSTTITVHGYTTPTVTFSRTSVPMDGSTTQNITISNQDSIYYYSLLIQWANNSYSQVFDLGNTTAASITKSGITYPLTWNNGVPNATSGTASLKVYVRAGSLSGTVVEIVEKSFTLTVPSSVVPSTTISLTGQDLWHSLYVQNRSKVQITGTFTGSYGSTLASYKFYNGSTLLSTQTSSATYTTGVLANSGSQTMKVTVTDSRGRTATATQAITVQVYFKPYISPYKAFRSDSSGNAKDDGTYITVQATANYASLNGENSRTMKAATKASSASSYSNERTVTSGTATVMSGTYNVDDIYTVRFTVTDAYGSTGNTVYVSVSSVYVGIVYDRLHKAVGVNTYPPSDGSSGLFTGKLGARFDGPIYISSKSGDSAVDGWKLLNNSLIYRGNITGDMNNYFMSGVYRVEGTAPSNYPSGATTWSHIIVLNANNATGQGYPADNGFTRQIVFATNGIYERVYAGSPAAWGAWHTYFSSSGLDGRYLPLNGGGTVNGNIEAVRSGTNATVVVAENDNGRVAIESATNRGLYDATLSKWIAYRKQDTTDTAVYVPTNLKVNDQYKVLSEGYTGYGFRGGGQFSDVIPNNSNINNYYTPGTYWVSSNGNAATMTNLPVSKAGVLYVLSGNGGVAGGSYIYRRQIFIVSLGEDDFYMHYERIGLTGSGTTVNWSSWRAVYHTISGVMKNSAFALKHPSGGSSTTLIRANNDYSSVELNVGWYRGLYDRTDANWMWFKTQADTETERTDASSLYLYGRPITGYKFESGWKTISGSLGSSIEYRKIDQMITVNVHKTGNNSVPSGWSTLGTLPPGYRPEKVIYTGAYTNQNGLYSGYIGTDGSVQIYNSTGAAKTNVFHYTVTYPQAYYKTAFTVLCMNIGEWSYGGARTNYQSRTDLTAEQKAALVPYDVPTSSTAYYGKIGLTDEEYSAKKSVIKTMFDNIAPNICIFTEWNKYVDCKHNHLARNDFFPSATYSSYLVSESSGVSQPNRPTLISRYSGFTEVERGALSQQDTSHGYLLAERVISGVTVGVLCVHFHHSNATIRAAQMDAAIQKMNDKGYNAAIIAGDFNFGPDTSERDTQFAKATADGYQMINGDAYGIIGWKKTWPNPSSPAGIINSDQSWYIDNILVKGRLRIVAGSMPTHTGAVFPSDHRAIWARVELY